MSDLSDRDRVTAILAKCAKHRARWPTEQNPSMTVKVRDVELLGSLLEALDTIERVNALFAGGPDTACRTVWDGEIECVSVPIEDLRQALNGGNE